MSARGDARPPGLNRSDFGPRLWRAFALGFVEHLFAEAKTLRSGFDEFVEPMYSRARSRLSFRCASS
jgi:hypothetical protein